MAAETENGAMHRVIEMVPELGKDSVRMKDPSMVAALINKLVDGGCDTLQVIADFDHTITKQHVNGESHVSSFCIVFNCNGLPTDFKERDRALCAKYLPIERDPHMSKEEKCPLMVEFYQHVGELYTGFALEPEEITRAVEKSHTELREGFHEMVSTLDRLEIPVCVFSAGLGDSVKAVLAYHSVVNSNIHVVSNFLKFKDGLVSGFTNDIVHAFNKNGQAAEHTEYFQLMSSRHNVILMGDCLGDADMANGVPNINAILKIGFLYGDVDTKLPKYLEHFDIVLIDDQTMDLANSLVQLISNGKLIK